MPFHVVVAPLTDVVVIADELPGRLPLEFTPDDLRRLEEEVRQALDGGPFARATAIDLPPFDALDPLAALRRRARERSSADLLVTLELTHGTTIHHDVGPRRSDWMPWWLPGPWFWWLPDIAYGANAVLVARVHDLAREEGSAGPLELRRWSFSHAHAMDDVELDFVDRAGDAWQLYLLSLVMPSTAVGRTREGLEVDLRRRFTAALAGGLSDDLSRLGGALVRGESTQSFHLVPDETAVTRLDGGRVGLTLTLSHRVGSTRNEPSALGLALDDGRPRLEALPQAEVDAAYLGPDRSGGAARYRFVRELEAPPEARFLRVHVRAGRAVSAVREYTLRIPPP
jgi:hypothetical protein